MNTERIDRVVVRFAGDSGDGMQLVGDRFTGQAAAFGNDLATFPNFPAEIRAPQGTVHGVSSFQVHFASSDILTPGDAPDVLVAMNPAALRANAADVSVGGVVIVDPDEFTKRNIAKAGYVSDPLSDGSLAHLTVHQVTMGALTLGAVSELGLGRKEALRCRNLFALGLLSWMYGRPTEVVEDYLRKKFAKKPLVAQANILAFRAGWNFGETTEMFAVSYEVPAAALPEGTYRHVSGNAALALGIIAAGWVSGMKVVLGTYPITPASDILHELAKHKNFPVLTIQAEDEISAVGAALGASFGGALGVTTTSGPGLALKSETIGLAVMAELPLLVVDVQRGGPSTGLPTKTEQADLLQAMFGRHGESPVAVVAPSTPADCFDAALEAVRIAVTYRTPVLLLSDGALANGAEPWRLPVIDQLPDIRPDFSTEPNAADGSGTHWPYVRDQETLARAWAIPGTPGLEHRIGGLEKAADTGAISYDPANHEFMVRLRQQKIAGIDVADLDVHDPSPATTRTLILGWGSTYGPIQDACRRLAARGVPVAHAHLRHLNPFPANLDDVLARYERVIVPEMNLGQLALLLRGRGATHLVSHTQVTGQPFKAGDLEAAFLAYMEGVAA